VTPAASPPPTDKTLQSIIVPAAITGLPNGTAKTAAALGLPPTVALITDGGNISAGVAWNVAACSYNPALSTAQAFTVDGTITLPSGVANPKGLALTVRISVAVAAAIAVDPNNNAAIGSDPRFDLGTDKIGTGWSWDAAAKTLTLTGGDVGAINIVTDGDIGIVLTGDASASNITNAGTGKITITGGPDKKLTLNSASGPAISAEGDIVIDSGHIYASTTDADAAAIESLAGSVVITGGAYVEADSSAGGSAIKAAVDVEISTAGGVVASANGTGYALDAGNMITVTDGTTELWASDEAHAFSVTPNISGADTFVHINGSLYYGEIDTTPPDGENRGGGCDTGLGAAGIIVLSLGLHAALYRKKR
jgi:hypothetical protein